jgi:phospholipid transport system transporter-binding protein
MTKVPLQFVDDNNGILSVQGHLTLDTAEEGLQQGQRWIKRQTVGGQIDLGKVTQSDSAGVALLVEWARFAKQQRLSIQFLHLPSQLLTIARVSGLYTVLPII